MCVLCAFATLSRPTKVIAMDCEMVGTGKTGESSVLARCVVHLHVHTYVHGVSVIQYLYILTCVLVAALNDFFVFLLLSLSLFMF